jgi:hypothetical protein
MNIGASGPKDAEGYNSVSSKAKEVNANKSTAMPFTPQGLDGNACCGDKKENCK